MKPNESNTPIWKQLSNAQDHLRKACDHNAPREDIEKIQAEIEILYFADKKQQAEDYKAGL